MVSIREFYVYPVIFLKVHVCLQAFFKMIDLDNKLEKINKAANHIRNHATKYVFDPKNLETCAICLEDFNQDGIMVLRLKCNSKHVFHRDCIGKWMERGKN